MAAIHLRGYLFFSALIPSVIYALVALLLIWVLSNRIEGGETHYIPLLLVCIVFSAIFKMGKDIPLLLKNAIETNKFHLTEEDKVVLEKFKTKNNIKTVWIFILFLSAMTSVILGGIAFSLLGFIEHDVWFLSIMAVTALPLMLFLSLFFANVKIYQAICNKDISFVSGVSGDWLMKWFVMPEAFSFLIINLSILLPLHGMVHQALDAQVVTIALIALITSAFLFVSINADAKNQVSGVTHYLKNDGSLFFEKNRSESELDPKSYKIRSHSYWKWIPGILAFQLMVFASTKYVFLDDWFYPFVFVVELFWVFIFSMLRTSVVRDTFHKIIHFRFQESLEQKPQVEGEHSYDL